MDKKQTPTIVNIEERVETLVKGMATMLSFSSYYDMTSKPNEIGEFDQFLESSGIGEKLEKILIEEFTEKGLTAEA